MTDQRTALMHPWIESEAGFGQRPDGCSLHQTSDDLAMFLQDYWDSMPDRDNPPTEYSRPEGISQVMVIPDELYARLTESKNGIRLWQHEFQKLMNSPLPHLRKGEAPKLVLYAVRNENGEFLRSKGFNGGHGGGGKTWVSTLEEAKIYGKPGLAKARITWFQNNFPQFKTLELVKLHVERVEVIDQTERVKKVQAEAQKQKLATQKRIAEQQIAGLEQKKKRIEAEMKRLKGSL